MVAARGPQVVSVETALEQIASGTIPSTVVVAGADGAARDRVTRALREAIGTGGFRLVDGEELSGGLAEVAAELGALNLLAAARRLVHVRRAEALAGRAPRGRKAAATDVSDVPRGRTDVVLLWETEEDPRSDTGALAQVIGTLTSGVPDAVVVDCSVPIGREFAERVRARAAEWGCRLRPDAVRALEAIARTDAAGVDRVVCAVAASIGDGEATAADVDALRVATRNVSPDFLRALSTAVSASDAAESLRLWANAGDDRGDPAPGLGYIGGSLLASLEKGYGARRTVRRTAELIEALRWVDASLKSGVRERDTPYAYLVAHMSGVDLHRNAQLHRPPR